MSTTTPPKRRQSTDTFARAQDGRATARRPGCYHRRRTWGFIGGLSSKALNARIREVVEGPEGALYLLTDEDNGRLLKVTPRT